MIRILIADDNEVFRKRVRDLLEVDPSISVIGEASTGKEAIYYACKLEPDLVLMDVRMPILDGIQATKILKEKLPDLKVIVLTVYNLDEYRKAACSSGADRFELKKTIYKELVPAIHEVTGLPKIEL
ncbi:MAG: response regulator transcription factor [Fidelibacterota bacterium]